MANINDFKLVNKYSKDYFKNIKTNNKINESQYKRLGFYLFILECVTGNPNLDDLQDSIIDTEFCKLVYNKKNNDYGIDAVYIDEENHTIKLFNYKFREKFNNEKGQNERNILDSSKFLMKLNSDSFTDVDEITRNKMKQIQSRFNSDDIWKTELYLVSNDRVPLASDNNTLNDFKDSYDIKVKPITLDDIVSFISERPDALSAEFIIDSNSVLTYEENSLSTQKSYLVKLPLSTLIRITCSNPDIRNDSSMKELSELRDVNLELGVLYDNVRGYLGNTKFNKSILNTLKEEPSRFFMYNNGITITAQNIIMKSINGKQKYSCKIDGFQIVNGGQSLRTIYEYKREDFNEENLAVSEVLVRLFKTEFDEELTNNIAEYTNSQNAISSTDLKSISNLQIQIEKYLETEGINYIRKAGDIKFKDRNFNYRITMERLAQLIYSYKGYPDRATNQKSQLFERYYDDIFDKYKLDFKLYVNLVKDYKKVEDFYENSNYKSYNQKYLYVIFLMGLYKEEPVNKFVDVIESTLKEYKKDENLSDARKLIQKGFKELLFDNAKNHFEF